MFIVKLSEHFSGHPPHCEQEHLLLHIDSVFIEVAMHEIVIGMLLKTVFAMRSQTHKKVPCFRDLLMLIQ